MMKLFQKSIKVLKKFGIEASKIALTAAIVLNLIAGNEINLTSKNINIASECFNVDKDGKITLIDNGVESGVLNIIGGNYNSSMRSFGAIFKSPDGYVGIESGYTLAGGSIYVAPSQSEIAGGSDYTLIQNGKVNALTISQRSLESAKKNFEKLDSGLDIIKDIDIYKYNLKNEEDTTKKHIGFVIGDNYNYSKEFYNS